MKLSVHERLGRLNAQEDGWDELDFELLQAVLVGHHPSGIYNSRGACTCWGMRVNGRCAAVEGDGQDVVEED